MSNIKNSSKKNAESSCLIEVNSILEVNDNIDYVVDVLVKYLYTYKKSSYMTTLWECFGDIIVRNLKNNVAENSIQCEVCGKRIEQINNKSKYCPECAREINRIKTKERMKELRCLK